MQNDPRMAGLALIVRKYGARVPGGAYEVFVSDAEAKSLLTPWGSLQEQRDAEKGGVFLRYFPNATIEGEGAFGDVTPIGASGTIAATGELTEEGEKFFGDILKEGQDESTG